MQLRIEKLITPTQQIATTMNVWANDPSLVHLIRPNRDRAELQKIVSVTTDSLAERL